MTNFKQQPNADGLVKLSGKITGYHRRREMASFVFRKTDQTRMGVVAIAAALAGLSGQAMATASNATSMEEEADHVQFRLDGQLVKGWVWRSPFKEGDVVEVAAEWQGDHYEAFGIARPGDRTIALYPHCSRGRARHVKNAIKWWLWLGVLSPFLFFLFAMMYFDGISIFFDVGLYATTGVMSTFLALMFTSLSLQWMPYVRVAEKVFKALDWPDASNIDLVKSSKAQRTEKDPGEFGTFYFRY
jgi:hypothetical protein